MTGFLGMRGNGDWVDNQRPENWRQTVLFLFPNGSTPITAITSMLGEESTDDPVYHWWTKGMPEQGGAITDIYTNAGLSSALGGGAVASGVTVYAKVAEAVASEFRPGHTAMFQKQDDGLNYAYVGKVTDVLKSGANSYIAVRMLERASATYDLASTDLIEVVGNSNAEGATMPSAISYDPVEYFNYTQIFRTPLSITRTARKTRLRTGDAYQELKREALMLHAIEMEKAFIFGVRSSGTGSNGKPERTTGGLRKFIVENAPDNVSHYPTTAGYGGVSWTNADGGIKWLNEQLEVIFRYGRSEKLALAGSMAILGLNRLAETSAEINITPTTTAYGLRVLEWITPFGTIYLKHAPLMTNKAAMRRDMMIIEPENLRFRYIDDTFFVEDPQDRKNRNNSRDGTEEEYITEGGLEIHHPTTMGYLSGIGLTGTTST